MSSCSFWPAGCRITSLPRPGGCWPTASRLRPQPLPITMVTEHNVPLLSHDIDAARSLAGKPGALKNTLPVARYPRLPFWFSAFCPGERLDTDDLDEVMAQAAQDRIALIVGVWRVWRLPLDGFSAPDAGFEQEEVRPSAAIDPDQPGRTRRIYVVQVPDRSVAPAVAGDLQAALAAPRRAKRPISRSSAWTSTRRRTRPRPSTARR